MGETYKPLHPAKYPTRWLYAANKCAAAPGGWISVESPPREGQALRRMMRMRAFHKGLRAFPTEAPKLCQMLENGYELRFRKIFHYGVWDVQMSLQPCKPDLAGLIEEAGK